MAKLTDGQAKVLLEPNLGVVVTMRLDGSAHMTPVWVDARDGDVLFNTAEGRAKPRRLLRDPRVGHEYRGGGLGQRIIVRVHADRIESRGT